MSEKTRSASSKKTNASEDKQLSLPIQKEMEKEMPVKTSEEKQKEDQGKDFEAALLELESVVAKLEGEVKLEEALQLFDRGMQLSQHCQEFLKSAEQKIEILKKAANGNLVSEKFSDDSAQSS